MIAGRGHQSIGRMGVGLVKQSLASAIVVRVRTLPTQEAGPRMVVPALQGGELKALQELCGFFSK
jgi:hypothetical protein